jgi:hypothetical protein
MMTPGLLADLNRTITEYAEQERQYYRRRKDHRKVGNDVPR